MNDPWNVKSVRESGLYQSCMKINGVPLLPPVLSEECRKEMQYYKLLAKEVEKRISMLRPYLEGVPAQDTDKSDADNYVDLFEKHNPEHLERELECKLKSGCEMLQKNDKVKVKADAKSRNFVIDLSLRINHSELEDVTDSGSVSSVSQNSLLPIEPEKDCEFSKTQLNSAKEKQLLTDFLNDYPSQKPEKELILDKEFDVGGKMEKIRTVKKKKEMAKETVNISFDMNKDSLSDAFLDLVHTDAVAQASKSFTGSLIDIHSVTSKDCDLVPGLVRQRSYTVLEPSPQLIAHLELQSQNEGVEVTSISMSESISNMSPNQRKRRSWDLETAKMKWSSMALELKQHQFVNGKKPNGSMSTTNRPRTSSDSNYSPYRSRAATQGARRPSLNSKYLTKSHSLQKGEVTQNLQKAETTGHSLKNAPSDRTITKQPVSPEIRALIKDRATPKPNGTPKPESPRHAAALMPESENSAIHIRELYETIQQQQVMQMTSLMEKQKKEQMLLHQLFEEQNNILFKQLKMICPKSPVQIRQAWGDKKEENYRQLGPVSLSQLNNVQKALPGSNPSSPVAKTLTETNRYISHCNDVLKRSRDITSHIKTPQPQKRALTSSNGANKQRTPSPEISKNRTRSPPNRNTSRKLNYESASDYEPMLTDRTNDTLADLNVTFPSDSEGSRSLSKYGTEERKPTPASAVKKSTDTPIRNLKTSMKSPTNGYCVKAMPACLQTSPEKQKAATKIVAGAKGYLVRRLMRTERVQATVATIRDALLCALQLHQDREGIRGADVDLHRRLIQQITAACYALHDTFVASTPAERCALIAADRARLRLAPARRSPAGAPRSFRQTDVMSRSHSGVFPARSKRPPSATSLMTQSHHETFSGPPGSRRRPWR